MAWAPFGRSSVRLGARDEKDLLRRGAMVRPRKLSATEKQRIISDWVRRFPSMVVYEPMSIGRRVGPMLHGISLGLSSDNASYSPALHIHNLCRPLGFVTLGMRQLLLTQRTGTKDSIAIRFHEKHVEEAAQRLASSSLLPVDGDMSMKQVLGALREMQIRKLGDWNYPIGAMEDA